MAFDGVLTNGASEILKKLVTVIGSEISLVWGVKDDLKRLKQTLEVIAAVTSDAERKQLNDASVSLWLKRLKQGSYDADDVLDEMSYEAMRRSHKNSKVKVFFSSSNQLVFRHKMSRKIKDVNIQFDQISTDMQRFQLQTTGSTSGGYEQNNKRLTTSLFGDNSKFVGRKEDKSKIVKMLTTMRISSWSSSLASTSSCVNSNQHEKVSEISELPESLTCNVRKLEVVNLGEKCKFPEDIQNLVKLRHLKYSGETNNVLMPRGIEKLTRLEVLEPFICSYHSSSSSIQQLADLNSLRKLVIENLVNVEADRAKLKDKQNIDYLELRWKIFKEDEEEEVAVNNSGMVLEGLQPHPNLKTLEIWNFPGLKLPKWIGSSSCLPNLVSLTFDSCKNCTKLVGLGQLPCLRILEMEGMNSVKCLGKDFYYQQKEEGEEEEEGKGPATAATTTRPLFPSLTDLSILKMNNLEEWFAPENSFPCLEKVEIKDCGNLTSIPDLRLWTSSLRSRRRVILREALTIRDCKKLEKEPIKNYLDKFLPSVRYIIYGA